MDPRRQRVVRALYEMGLQDASWIEEWEGDDLELLRDRLTPEEYQTLLDQLEDEDAR